MKMTFPVIKMESSRRRTGRPDPCTAIPPLLQSMPKLERMATQQLVRQSARVERSLLDVGPVLAAGFKSTRVMARPRTRPAPAEFYLDLVLHFFCCADNFICTTTTVW